MINKEAVKQSFDRCGESYNIQASVQHEIAGRLAVLTQLHSPFRKVLEIGCGTGFLTSAIINIHRPEHYIINDISVEMINKTINCLNNISDIRIEKLEGDAETVDFPNGLDAIVSSSAIQWFTDAGKFFSKAADSLKKGGILAISTFGTNNFLEINSLTGRGLKYKTDSELKNMIERHFTIHNFENETVTQWFDSPVEVLSHIRCTGVGCTLASPMGAGAVRRFISDYQKQFADNNGRVSLTWNPVIIIATKR